MPSARIALLSLAALGLVVALVPSAYATDPDGKTPVNIYLRSPDGGTVRSVATAEGAQHVEVINSGQSPLPVYSPVCTTTSQAVVVVGTSAVTAPTSPLPGRKSLRVCVSLENVGSPKVKCALDSTPVMGFTATDAGTPIGDVLQPGDCFGYSVDTTHVVKCISDTAGTGVITYECS